MFWQNQLTVLICLSWMLFRPIWIPQISTLMRIQTPIIFQLCLEMTLLTLTHLITSFLSISCLKYYRSIPLKDMEFECKCVIQQLMNIFKPWLILRNILPTLLSKAISSLIFKMLIVKKIKRPAGKERGLITGMVITRQGLLSNSRLESSLVY